MDIIMDQVGDITDGYIVVEWFFDEGDSVTEGAVLCVVEIGKASVDVEAPKSGVLHKIYINADQELNAGDILGEIL